MAAPSLLSNAHTGRNSPHRQEVTRTPPGNRRWLGVHRQLPKIMMYLQSGSYTRSGTYSPHPGTDDAVLPKLHAGPEVGPQLPKIWMYPEFRLAILPGRNRSHLQVGARGAGGDPRWLNVGRQLPKLMTYLEWWIPVDYRLNLTES